MKTFADAMALLDAHLVTYRRKVEGELIAMLPEPHDAADVARLGDELATFDNNLAAWRAVVERELRAGLLAWLAEDTSGG